MNRTVFRAFLLLLVSALLVLPPAGWIEMAGASPTSGPSASGAAHQDDDDDSGDDDDGVSDDDSESDDGGNDSGGVDDDGGFVDDGGGVVDDGVDDGGGFVDDGGAVAVPSAPPVSPIVDDDGDPRTDGYRAGQAVVRLQPGAAIDDFSARNGTAVIASIPGQDLYLLQLPAYQADTDSLRLIVGDAETRWAELNYVSEAPEGRPGYFFVSGEISSKAGTTYAPQLLGAPAAQSCASGTGVIVAVLDTGVDAAHPALAGRVLDRGRNVLADSADTADVGNGLDDDLDGLVDEMAGHGTHVAGIVAQVAPGATILPVRVLDSDGVGDAFFVAAGIYAALDEGADVINLSLSSTYDARIVDDAVSDANDAGALVVAAYGNADRARPLEFPASHDAVIGVAATDESDRKSDFSNYGARVDLSAPGTEIVSALPGGLYATWSGTSMAAPFVAGAAALLASANPDWTADDIAARLKETAKPLGDLNEPRLKGKLGAGRIDLAAAAVCGETV